MCLGVYRFVIALVGFCLFGCWTFNCFTTIRCRLPPLNYLCSFVKSDDCSCIGLSVLYHWSIHLLFAQYHTVLTMIALNWSWNQVVCVFQICSSLALCWPLCLLLLHINFRVCAYLQNSFLGFWLGLHCLYRSFWDDLAFSYWVPIHEHGIFLHLCRYLISFITVF